MIAWVMPEANQAFRVMASGEPNIRADNEISFPAQRETIEVLKLTPGGRVAARPMGTTIS